MSGLAEFLLARTAEDEAVAKAATPGPWSIDEREDDVASSMWAVDGPIPAGEQYEATVVEVAFDRDYGSPQGGCDRLEDAEHIARHDPARILAECDAKRRIVAEHPLVQSATQADVIGCDTCGWEDFSWGPEMVTDGPCLTLRLLALPYADHPDYDPAWRP